jgi:hypothetical protein
MATEFEDYFLDLVNGTRAAAGVLPLTFDNELMQSAEDHNTWMDATDTDSHTGVDGKGIEERIRDGGYDGIYVSENIWYSPTFGTEGESRHWVEQSHKWYVESPKGHYETMINPNFQHIGISFQEGDYNGQPAVFSTLNFGGDGPQGDSGGGPGDTVEQSVDIRYIPPYAMLGPGDTVEQSVDIHYIPPYAMLGPGDTVKEHYDGPFTPDDDP